MLFNRTPNLTSKVRVRRASAPATGTSQLAASVESVTKTFRRMSLPLVSTSTSPSSPSPVTLQQSVALRRMAPRDPSPPLELEPSVADVGGLKRVELKYPHDDVKPLTPLEQVKLVLGFMPRLDRTPASASHVSRVEYYSTEAPSAMGSVSAPLPSRVRVV